MKLRVYRINITKAYSIWEQGEGYSLRPWSGNDATFEGHDADVVIELPEGVSVAMHEDGIRPVLLDAKGKDLEMFAGRKGYVKLIGVNTPPNGLWCKILDIDPATVPDAAELLAVKP